jgi:hypothetical protein
MGRPEQRSASLHWTDNREKAVRMAEDWEDKARAAEAQKQREWAMQPAGSDLEFWGRQVVSGFIDYTDAWSLIWNSEVEALKGRSFDHDKLAGIVDNKLDWATREGERWYSIHEPIRAAAAQRMEQHDAEFRATASPAQWADQIRRGNADIPEVLRAMRGSRVDDESTWKAMQSLREAMEQRQERSPLVAERQGRSR